MLSPLLFQKIYQGTLQERLDFSRTLHAALGPQLMRERSFTEPFASLRKAADTLAACMAGMAMGGQCAACSASNPGGCCSREMAEETDALQMLMNLLAGVEIGMRDNGLACCFLGRQGCIFVFKPMFCLNYNCNKIINLIGPARYDLEALTGRLLGKQYEIEKALIARIERLPEFAAG